MQKTKNTVLFLTSEFPPLPGGIGNHACNLSLALCDYGYQVCVLADYRTAKKNNFMEDEHDSKLPFPVIRISNHSNRWFTYLQRIHKTIKFLNRNKHIYVITSGQFPLWLGAIMTLLYPSNIYISVIHGTELSGVNSIKNRLSIFSLNRYKVIVAVSSYTKKIIHQFLPLSTVEVINNGYLPTGIKPKQAQHPIQPLDPIRLITIGSLTPRKGQMNVIRALPLLIEKFPSLHYHMIGIPVYKEQLLIEAKKLKVSEYISFHGALPDDEKNELLAASDIFLLLSEHLENGDFEGFGIAIIEANGAGIPAIGSIHSGIEDAIKNGSTGFLIDPHDPLALVEKIERILADYPSFSASASSWADNFTWSKKGSDYVELLKQNGHA